MDAAGKERTTDCSVVVVVVRGEEGWRRGVRRDRGGERGVGILKP